MFKYEYYQEMENMCLRIAANSSGNLKTFYLNAAEGFRIKRENLTLREAYE